MFFRLKICFICVLMCLALSSCDERTKEDKSGSKILLMGTSADYPPFEFIKDQKVVGFDIDLAKAIASKLGYEIKISDISFPGLIPALQTGRIDFAVSGFTFTPKREKEVDFSIPYYSPSHALLFRKNAPLQDLDNLAGKRIGVQFGTSMEMILKFKKTPSNDFSIIAMTRTLPMVQDLKLNRLDGLLIEEAQAKVFVSKNVNLDYWTFSDRDYGYAIVFTKGSKLTEQFNEILVHMRDSGELDELKAKWFS